jgi:hypothetical protein
MTATLILDSNARRALAVEWVMAAPMATVLTFRKPGRTIPQNDRFWAMLTDVARQAQHNGRKYSADAWKALFMNALGHEVNFMMGLSGEPFPIGFRSSKLTKEQMSELMDFIEAWAAQNGVKLREEV